MHFRTRCARFRPFALITTSLMSTSTVMSSAGQTRQMMIAPREINDAKLPASSRNWVNERLIYTHGYGVTMNSANGFTPEGLPQFVLSNMPVESSA